jgi:hypothetical protein
MKLAFSSTVVVKINDLEHAITQIKDTELLGATGIVLRIHSQLWQDLMSNLEEIRRDLAHQTVAASTRAPGIDIFALPDGHTSTEDGSPYTARYAPRLLFGKAANEVLFRKNLDADIVASIRQQDLHSVVDSSRSRCVICAASGHHFTLPSGAHASQFLRLAEAFVDIEVVDRIAYWVALDICSKLRPLEDDPIALVVDHPSMLILGARVQRLVDRPLSLYCFPTYPSDLQTRIETFRLLDRVAVGHGDIFVVIGVASTGRLAKTINGWAEEKRANAATSILYALQAVEDQQILCHLHLPDYSHYGPETPCNLCAKGGTPIVIQSSSYMIGYGPSESLALQARYFDKQKEFLQKWGGIDGVLRVHFDDPNESTARHHAFYIDVGTLLDQSDFVVDMLGHILAFELKADAVVVPDHPTANRIGNIIRERLSIPLVVLDATLLNGGRKDDSLYAASTLLVVDDVFITGSRFDSINRFLRELGETHAPAVKKIQFFALLATPPSDRHYKARKGGMTGNHAWDAQLSHLYSFPLPDWHDGDSCPWCAEQRTLSRIAQVEGRLDDALSERLATLGQVSTGLTSDAYFLQDPTVTLPGLGAQSALMGKGATPLQVLFTCASAFQQLRHCETGRPLDASQFPMPTYVAHRVFSQHYTERTIWLGLLRALKGAELEKELKEYLRVAALNGADHQRSLVHGELAIAWLTGKLGPIEITVSAEAFFKAVDVPWTALLANGFVDATPSATATGTTGPENSTRNSRRHPRTWLSLLWSKIRWLWPFRCG